MPPRRAPGPQTYIGAQSILRQNATGKQMGFRLGRFVITNPGGGELVFTSSSLSPRRLRVPVIRQASDEECNGELGGIVS